MVAKNTSAIIPQRARLIVLTVQYRNAPQNFPGGLDDSGLCPAGAIAEAVRASGRRPFQPPLARLDAVSVSRLLPPMGRQGGALQRNSLRRQPGARSSAPGASARGEAGH